MLLYDTIDSYAVPHTEKVDELFVAINKDYHRNMYTSRRMIHRREVIVGWFSTTTEDGQVILDTSSLIHEFYSKECADPIHLVVDTSLTGDSIGARAFISMPMVAGPHNFGNMFHELRVDTELGPHEIICLSQIFNGQSNSSAPWQDTSVVAAIPPEIQALNEATEKLLARIDNILNHVNAVVDGTETARPEIGMALADVLGASQAIKMPDFHAVFSSKTQDMLMVSYLTTLLQNQLIIAEQLNQII